MAVDSGVFPLLEMNEKGRIEQTLKPENPIPVKDYLKAQGRFKKISDAEIELWQKEIG